MTSGRGAWPSARSLIVGVVGYPVAHSLSPLLHNTAFHALGLDWVSVGLPVVPEALADAVAGMRALQLRGVSVTMPHKASVAALVDRLSPTAAALGAVNCVAVDEDGLVGHNTDGEGFIASLQRGAGFHPAGHRCLVVGAGGASRAVVAALGAAGAREVVVVARTPAAGDRARALAGAAGRRGTTEDVPGADLVVNATPVGMTGTAQTDAPSVVDAALLHSGQIVVDLVYDPPVTPFLAAAAARGATPLGGLGMLVHQAAAQLRLWTGLDPPVDAMWAAVQTELGGAGHDESARRHGNGVAAQ